MKRKMIFCTLMIAALILGACGKKDSSVTETTEAAVPTEAPSGQPETQKTEVPVKTEAETTAAPETVPEPVTEAEAVAESEAAELLHVVVTEISRGENSCYDEYEIMNLTEEDAAKYPDLAAALVDHNGQEDYRSGERMRQLGENYEELKEFREEDFRLESYVTSDPVRADSQVLSVFHREYIYLGGAHPSTFLYGDSFDTETGKRLVFTDVVTEPEKFFDLVEEKLQEKYADDYPYMNNFTEYRKNLSYEDYRNVAWTIDPNGVTVYFNEYELGPYAMGAQVIRVCFSELPEVFSDRFTGPAEDYVIPLPEYIPAEIDVNGDGKPEEVSVEEVSTNPGEEYDYYFNHVIHVGNRSVSIENGTYSASAFVMRKDGKYFLYLFEQSDNDWVILTVVDLQTMEADPERTFSLRIKSESGEWEETDGGYVSTFRTWPMTDPNAIWFTEHCELLGTKSGNRTYYVGADGYPETEEGWISFSTYQCLKTRKEVACKAVSPDGTELSDTVIPEGTCLFFVRSDNETWIDVQAVAEEKVTVEIGEYGSMVYTEEPFRVQESEPLYRIYVNNTEWPGRVNGEDESEVFYGVQYAG